MELEIEGAVQQAPQTGRQYVMVFFIRDGIVGEYLWLGGPACSATNQKNARAQGMMSFS